MLVLTGQAAEAVSRQAPEVHQGVSPALSSNRGI
jgi:hypothetical protein